MSKIAAFYCKNTSYIYHMLSVAKCGYDNAYGDRYGAYHDAGDLKTLKGWEDLLSVSGGEHCGALYGLCVGIPASLEGDAFKEYLLALHDLFTTEDQASNLARYRSIYETAFAPRGITIHEASHLVFYQSHRELGTAIVGITNILLKNMAVYEDRVWSTCEVELQEVADRLNAQFLAHDYAPQWERAVGCEAPQESFCAMLCHGVEGGAQAIDIDHNKHVFGLPKDDEATVDLIYHEFVIYLLKGILQGTEGFRDFACYEIMESLAEYYNRAVVGGHSHHNWNAKHIEYYKALQEENPAMGAKAMFVKAKEAFTHD